MSPLAPLHLPPTNYGARAAETDVGARECNISTADFGGSGLVWRGGGEEKRKKRSAFGLFLNVQTFRSKVVGTVKFARDGSEAKRSVLRVHTHATASL